MGDEEARRTSPQVSEEDLEECWLVQPQSSLTSIQRVILGVLAKVASLLGYRAEYPYPYGRQIETSRMVM